MYRAYWNFVILIYQYLGEGISNMSKSCGSQTHIYGYIYRYIDISTHVKKNFLDTVNL